MILQIHQFFFNEKRFEIYGTEKKPLFLVNDIVCGLLGMNRPSDNQFFRDNKNNSKYVMMWDFPPSSKNDTIQQALQERFKKSNKKYLYFFTEKGLYRCLMKSNSPIAEQFQDEICDLLINIRNGTIELLQKQLAEKELNLLTNQLLLSKCETKVSIYKITNKNTGRQYVGSTNDPNRRRKQHSVRSSNPELRESVKRGDRLTFRIVGTVNALNKEDIKQVERQSILSVPRELRMNKFLPKPDINNLTLNIVKQIAPATNAMSNQLAIRIQRDSETLLPNVNNYTPGFCQFDSTSFRSDLEEDKHSDDLDRITEQTAENRGPTRGTLDSCRQNFIRRVAQLKEYLETHNGQYPKQSDPNKDVRKLAQWLEGVRGDYRNLTSEYMKWNKAYLLEQIPDFQWSDMSFQQNVDVIVMILSKTNNFPAERGIRGASDIYTWIVNVRRTLSNIAKAFNITDERRKYLFSKIPDFLLHAPRTQLPEINMQTVEVPNTSRVEMKYIDEAFESFVKAFVTFVKDNKRYPTEHSSNEHEKAIGYEFKKMCANLRLKISDKYFNRLLYMFAHIPYLVVSKHYVVLQNRLTDCINGRHDKHACDGSVDSFKYETGDKAASLIVALLRRIHQSDRLYFLRY